MHNGCMDCDQCCTQVEHMQILQHLSRQQLFARSLRSVVQAKAVHTAPFLSLPCSFNVQGVFPMGPLVAGSLCQTLFPGFNIYSLAASSVFSIP